MKLPRGPWWKRWQAHAMTAWRRVFPPTPERIPGKWPWARAKPLPSGFVLIPGPQYDLVADGRGGTVTLFKTLQKPPRPRGRASRR